VSDESLSPAGAPPARPWTAIFTSLITGIVLGVLLCAIAAWKFMPGMMIVHHESRYSTVEQTCEALKTAIEEAGWNVPAIRNMNKSIEEQGLSLSRTVRIVELCKAPYALDALSTNPELATLMPCAYGVYEGADGKIYISGMNMGLMGKMFGGRVAEIMGGKVASEEEDILRGVSNP